MLCAYGNCITALNLQIFNRWGQKVFETSDFEACWDGTQNGQELNAGVYIYKAVITLSTGEEIVQSGNITLIR